ncbi:MAG: nucleotidyltransferase domain-containing protein [Eubacteriales bacterium]|jgi:predicted nucleotidyltransferase|nr:nucleotidyltransferase domain-containing protein [Eubacteriales bacterium]
MGKRKNKREIASRETIIGKLKEAVTSLEKDIKIDKVYLFGSYANGSPKYYSDVDVAVISPDFGKNYISETVFLMEAFHGTGLMIEPHVFSREEYLEAKEGTFLYDEVMQKGITI